MRVSRLLLIAAAIVAIGLVATVATVSQPAAHRTSRSAAISRQPRAIGPLPDGGTIRFALNLRLHQRQLDEYLRRVDPGSGSRLTASRFGARFGQSEARLAQLRRVLNRMGIAVDRLYPQRTAMLVRSKVSRLHSLFALSFDRFALPNGQRYFAPVSPPRIPAALTPYITGLADLSDRPIPPADIPSSGLTPSLAGRAYDITPLWNAGFRGQGQTIAVATAFGAINPADVQTFAAKEGLPSPQISIKPVDGGSTYNPQNGSDQEVDLDLQVIFGIAPAARIIDYQGPDGSNGPSPTIGHSLGDIFNQIEQDSLTRIVSLSYGLCEPQMAPGDQQLIDNGLKALEASSVTVFDATGDSGAFACLQAAQIQPASNLPSQITALSVQSPASSPYAVSVGGTRLELRTDGSYLTESAWSNPLEREGGGGGVSASEPRPPWQQGPGVIQPSLNPNARRQVPDVAGPADPSSGFLICQTLPGSSTPNCTGGYGGTSAAAPFWSASMLLVQQFAAAHGAGAVARCFAGPILYDLAAKAQPVPAFHQVTRGNNGYYGAAPDWNFATGIGTPDVFNLAQDYASLLSGQSSHKCPF